MFCYIVLNGLDLPGPDMEVGEPVLPGGQDVKHVGQSGVVIEVVIRVERCENLPVVSGEDEEGPFLGLGAEFCQTPGMEVVGEAVILRCCSFIAGTKAVEIPIHGTPIGADEGFLIRLGLQKLAHADPHISWGVDTMQSDVMEESLREARMEDGVVLKGMGVNAVGL
jgi:hypothetical protein